MKKVEKYKLKNLKYFRAYIKMKRIIKFGDIEIKK